MAVYGLSDQDVADLKIFYEDTRKDTMFRANPFLAMVKKEEHDGQQIAQTIKYGYTAAHGPDFATNYANLGNSMQKRKQFFVPWYEGSALDQIGAKEEKLSATKKGALVNLVADALEGSQRVCANDIELACFNDGAGVIGTISSNSGSDPAIVLTLTRVGDAERVQVGDRLVSAASALAASLRTGSATVVAVDRDAGTITVDSISSWSPTNGDVLFLQSAKVGTLTVPQWFTGVAGWIPTAAPGSSDSFFSVNRSDDPAALAGRRLDGRTMSPKKAIRNLLSRVSMSKESNPDVVWVHPYTFDALLEDPEAQKTYDERMGEGTGSAAGLYFPGLRIFGPKGPAKVHASWAMHGNLAFATTMSTWHLHRPPGSPEGMVMMGGKDGDGLIDLIATNGKQVRSWWLAGLTCDFPGANGVVQLS